VQPTGDEDRSVEDCGDVAVLMDPRRREEHVDRHEEVGEEAEHGE